MECPQQVVLNALGQWIGRRFQQAYTEEEFRRLATTSLEKIAELNPGMNEETRIRILERYSPENMLKGYQEGFRTYSQTEETLRQGANTPISPGATQELRAHIEAYQQCCRKMISWVGKTREKFEEKFPEELSPEDLETAFTEVFPNPQDYSEFMNQRNHFSLLDLRARAQRGEVDPKAYQQQKAVYEATREIYREIFSKMFSDIYKQEGRI